MLAVMNKKIEVNKIFNESCLETLKRIPDNFVQAVITSPPYNMNLRIRKGEYCSRQLVKEISTKYDGFDDNLPIDEYNKFHSDVLKELLRVSNLVFYVIQIVTGSKRYIFKMIGDFSENLNFKFSTYAGKSIYLTMLKYYNKTKTIQETNEFVENYFRQFDNISFLNNNYEIYDNYCFIGTTLWSKITNPSYEINDVYNIPSFDYIQYNRLNMLSVDFLQDVLQKNENCIVITHHVPSSSLIDVKYKTQQMIPYNQWFYCNMVELFEIHGTKIKCWIYGHTHTQSNVIINDIPFLCNPIGYPNENNILDFQKIFTIGI
jgi:hypothetical protein